MDIENQIITVKVTNFTEKHFQSLGLQVKNGDIINIPAKYLPHGSGIKIKVICKYCHKEFKKAWNRYLQTKDDICCADCKKYKMMKTSLQKYGNVCSLCNNNIKAKRDKTFIEKYGTTKIMQNEYIKEKSMEKRRENGFKSINTSKQQIHLCEILNGELNYRILSYSADIFVKKDNVIVEYDGAGHMLSVEFGKISYEDFIEKEQIRDRNIINNGYKIIRLVNLNKKNKDKLPDDEEIFQIYENAINGFKKGYNLYRFNIQDKIESFEY